MRYKTVKNKELNRLIREVLDRGELFTMSVRGSSMSPSIRDRDQVTIVKADPGNMEKNDIVLYSRPDGQLIIHRIYEIKDKNGTIVYTISADASQKCQECIPAGQIIGKVIAIKRAGFLSRIIPEAVINVKKIADLLIRTRERHHATEGLRKTRRQ